MGLFLGQSPEMWPPWLKKMANDLKKLGDGVKTLGGKLGEVLKKLGKWAAAALPGLIGSIISFLFKAAEQAIDYLAKHAWLLILVVVVFLVKKLLKRRR